MTCQSVVPLSFARQSPLATAPPPEIARSRFPGAGLADLPENQQFASVTFLRPPRGVAFRAEHWTGSTSCLQENDNLVLDLADPAGPTKRADRPHATAQRDLAGHRHVAARRNAGHHRDDRGHHGDPRRRTVLGGCLARRPPRVAATGSCDPAAMPCAAPCKRVQATFL